MIFTTSNGWATSNGPLAVAPLWRPWPPKAGHERCRVANRWYNSSYTEPHHLLSALCFFTTTGWPPSTVHDFLAAIRPDVGWQEEWDTPKKRPTYYAGKWRRLRIDYGEAFAALMSGDYVSVTNGDYRSGAEGGK